MRLLYYTLHCILYYVCSYYPQEGDEDVEILANVLAQNVGVAIPKCYVRFAREAFWSVLGEYRGRCTPKRGL